jgi:hypothetical protein
MLLFTLLAVLAGQIFGLSTKENLLFDPSNVLSLAIVPGTKM